jgi:hypothetical protein
MDYLLIVLLALISCEFIQVSVSVNRYYINNNPNRPSSFERSRGETCVLPPIAIAPASEEIAEYCSTSIANSSVISYDINETLASLDHRLQNASLSLLALYSQHQALGASSGASSSIESAASKLIAEERRKLVALREKSWMKEDNVVWESERGIRARVLKEGKARASAASATSTAAVEERLR